MRFPDLVVAIDGPTGAGKTTLGEWLADQLQARVLETGFVYRAATACRLALRLDDAAIAQVIREDLSADFGRRASDQLMTVGQRSFAIDELRSADIDREVAHLSAATPIRDAATIRCRRWIETGRWVVLGRDVGTTIAPEASLKIYLTANRETQGQRAAAARGSSVRANDEAELLSERLRPAPDATVIDTSTLTIEGVRRRVAPLLLAVT